MTSYVENSLADGEQIVYLARLSLWPYSFPILLGLISILLPLWHHLSLWLMLPGIAIFCWLYALIGSVELAVTNRRIIGKTGIIRRATAELYLSRVEGVVVKQTMQGRLLNYGTLSIKGVGSEAATIANIAAPLDFRKAFTAEMDAMMQKASDGKDAALL